METILQIDFTILNWIQEHLRCDFLDMLCSAFGTIGRAGMLWIAVCVVMLFFKKTRAAGVIALAAMGVGYVLGDLAVKPLVQRPRPFVTDSDMNLFRNLELFVKKPDGFSFPSGHSCAAAAFETVMLVKARPIGWIALLPVLTMLFSRMYTYVHFPSDVLCGAVLGVLTAFLMLLLFRQTKLDKKLSPQ